MLKSKTFLKKTKAGGILKIVREHYLRDDIFCGLPCCTKCYGRDKDNALECEGGINEVNINKKNLLPLLAVNSSVSFENLKASHILIPDTNVVLHQVDFLEDVSITNVVILWTVLDEVKHQSLTVYKRLKDLLDNPEKHFYVFVNEHHCETYVERQRGESANDRNDRAIREACIWYSAHLKSLGHLKVVLLTNDRENKRKAQLISQQGFLTYTVKEYVDKLDCNNELLDKLAVVDAEEKGGESEKFQYPSHVSPVEIRRGLALGKYLQGTFRASRDNYLEGEVLVMGQDQPLFIQGRMNLNRAVNDDVVAVELLPRTEWGCPSSLVLEDNAVSDDLCNNDADDQKENNSTIGSKRESGKIVGVIKRNWRQYCGMLQPSTLTETNKHLFVAAERRIPKIRIETRQAQSLFGKRIIVVIDSWPKNSRYPQGHLVRVLGEIGDKSTENQVLLLEHDIPHTAFSQKVLSCLPDPAWTCSEEELSKRKDLRGVIICSVDPPGCTDIDDALHCRKLPNGNFEVGCHIADVSHFVRPLTALDLEAANRCTTVYLTDRRIDMVPELLSSNLCSLISNVERLAFSVLWEITPDAEIVSVQFTKSVIKSKASLTYAAAQAMIDNAACNDDLAVNLRSLNELAKKLKARRLEDGALTLASPEIRFEMDNETHDPIQVQEKLMLDTNSMVEEFMLLANVSVAKKIYQEFPQCSVLRRHALPPYSNFEPLLAVCKAYKIPMDVSSNKSLAVSLDEAIIPENPFFNTMLRILTTRCMMQAKYFTSGLMPEGDFYHYGLAMNIYTHFTSPIRRYADILVHRLLAVAIGADASYPELLDKSRTQEICNLMNHRHVMAQHASRASVGLHTLLFFKTRNLFEQGYILNIRKNALQIYIPKFGLEGTLYLDNGPIKASYNAEECTQTVSGHTFHIFDPVTVRISLDASNIQHQKLRLDLVKPKIDGLSIDDDLGTEEANKERTIDSQMKTPRKKKKTKK